uniref:Short salivary lipocalin n=1 Tax=Triatoma infestans TaxID=30076 RepID=A6YPR2_TRIIF|nr:short salivary lipocalin [Triatoma infestans]
MKTFIALTFIGILTYAYAQSSGISECKTVKAKTDFSAKRFLITGDTTFEAVFVIMDTDYNNYALFYRCVSFPTGYRDDNYLVLSRTGGGQEIPASLKSLTSDLQLQSCVNIMTVVL